MATDVKMPEPAFRLRWNAGEARYTFGKPNAGDIGVYTAAQLEQYAEERVREALEAAAKACEAERALFMEQAVANNGRESDFASGSVNSSERLAEVIRALKKENGA